MTVQIISFSIVLISSVAWREEAKTLSRWRVDQNEDEENTTFLHRNGLKMI